MNKLIIINGKPKSGKDQFVKFFKKHSNKKVNNLSTVDEVKKIAKKMGWNGEKDYKSRKLLSDLKKIWTEYNDGIFKNLCNFIDNESDSITFIHSREPEEIKRFKEKYQDYCTTLLIKRKDPWYKKLKNVFLKKQVFGNYSDDNVEKYDYDEIFYNDSNLKNFESKVKDLAANKNFSKSGDESIIKEHGNGGFGVGDIDSYMRRKGVKKLLKNVQKTNWWKKINGLHNK